MILPDKDKLDLYPVFQKYWIQRTDKVYLKAAKEPEMCEKLGEHITVLQLDESVRPHKRDRVCVNCGKTTLIGQDNTRI